VYGGERWTFYNDQGQALGVGATGATGAQGDPGAPGADGDNTIITREVGGSDIVDVAELEFDASDFVVTDQTGGIARVALTAPGAGTTDVQEGGSSVVAAATALNFAAADFNITDETGGVAGIALAGGGGGGGGAALLPLDIVPGSPDAQDDEFPGSSLDGKWTDPATSTRTTITTVANGWCLIQPSETGTGNIASKGGVGIRQAAPAGSFTMSAKIATAWSEANTSDDSRTGLFTGRLSSTVKGLAFGIGDSGDSLYATWFDGYSHTADWGSFDGTQSYVDRGNVSHFTRNEIMWARLRYNASTSVMYYDLSWNGVLWTPWASRSSVQQPEHIGLALWSNSGNLRADHFLAINWFRVIDGSAAFTRQ
jgi:hypothetical protein